MPAEAFDIEEPPSKSLGVTKPSRAAVVKGFSSYALGEEVEITRPHQLSSLTSTWQTVILFSFLIGLCVSIVTVWPWDRLTAGKVIESGHYLELPYGAYYVWILVWVADLVFALWQFFQSIPNGAQQWTLDTIIAVGPGYCWAHIFGCFWAYAHKDFEGFQLGEYVLDFVFLGLVVLALNFAHQAANVMKDENITGIFCIRLPITLRFAWCFFALFQSLSHMVVMAMGESGNKEAKLLVWLISICLLTGCAVSVSASRRSLGFGLVIAFAMLVLGLESGNQGGAVGTLDRDWGMDPFYGGISVAGVVSLVDVILGTAIFCTTFFIVVFFEPPLRPAEIVRGKEMERVDIFGPTALEMNRGTY